MSLSSHFINNRREAKLPTRNTGVLCEINQALGDPLKIPPDALERLENHFKDSLLIVAGSTQTVASHAEYLRLAITTPEAAEVLDFVASKALAGITIDHCEEAINTLFPDRFIEP
jgi:chromosomal replication initiation ATPase DnaA